MIPLNLSPLKYCKHCRELFSDGIIHFTKMNCIMRDCGRRLKKIRHDMCDVISKLNKNNYFVKDASLESDSIYILFDRSCRFNCLPVGFDLRGVNDDDGEPSALLFYKEPNKTPEELIIIRNQLLEWVKKLTAFAR